MLGRRAECELLDQLLVDLRAQRSTVLVLCGEAGVGKTAMLDYLTAHSAGCRVVRTTGVESEMELPFAGLHQACASMLDRIERLPDPQRDALSVAFGLAPGGAADPFLVGLAFLNLVSDAAEEHPVVCIVDDAQWLDRVSAQVMAFAARRLQADPVAIVFAAREAELLPELRGLPRHTIAALGDADARALLRTATRGPIDERVRDRVIAESGGNPLAILELPRATTPAQLAGGFVSADSRPPPGHVEHSFIRRVAALPPNTQRLLLAAAAEPVGDVALLRRAAAKLGIEPGDEDPAVDAGLIQVDTQVRFRHPLVRSAAYRAATVADRRAVHRAIADVTDPDADPDRRAWHRAQAADLFDDDLATDLERAAGRARRRGGLAAAAAFLHRAAQLTTDPAKRSQRALSAADAKFDAGSYDEVEALLAEAEPGTMTELQRALVARLRAQVAEARQRGNQAAPLLLAAAKGLETLDSELARETYLDALGAAIFAGRLGRHPGLVDIADAARQAPAPHGAPRSLDVLLDAVAHRFSDGFTASVAVMRSAVHHFAQRPVSIDEDVRWHWLVWLLAGDMWDDEARHDLATRAVRAARDNGALTVLPIALNYLASTHIEAGEFSVAARLIDEADDLAAAIDNARPRYASLLLASWRNDAHALDFIEHAVVDAERRGEGRAVSQGAFFAAITFNALGRFDDARAAAVRACEYDDLGVHGFALVELVEAAARSGSLELAATALRDLEARTTAIGTDWAQGMLARCRALVTTDDAAAESHHLAAIDHLGNGRTVVQLARARLTYGEWLRREGRRLDARQQLRIAHETFDTIGAAGFAERARRELRAAGDTSGQRSTPNPQQLTAQEAQIAELAAQGHTNAQIGSDLFITAKTVEYHLKKVFTKLEISSRRELPDALAAPDPTANAQPGR